MTEPTPLVELVDLHAGYDGIEVLHGINLKVPEGEMFAVLGPNGAGKTTMLKVISGLLTPTSGDVVLAGEVVSGVDTALLARAGVSVVPEMRGVFANLTVRENLRMAIPRHGNRSDVEERAFTRFPRLSERRNQLAGTMSGGEQQMLAIARALAPDPALVLLDELSSGLAPLIVAELLEHVSALTDEGVTVIVVEQFAHAVIPIVDSAGLLVNGQLRVGSPKEIDEQLHAAYLGDGGASPPVQARDKEFAQSSAPVVGGDK
jgi:branched-chain amino acid transport system ATP-binding protein